MRRRARQGVGEEAGEDGDEAVAVEDRAAEGYGQPGGLVSALDREEGGRGRWRR